MTACLLTFEINFWQLDTQNTITERDCPNHVKEKKSFHLHEFPLLIAQDEAADHADDGDQGNDDYAGNVSQVFF